MTVYNEKTGFTLLTNATDPQGLVLRIYKVNGNIINWGSGPTTVSLFGGAVIATITEFGVVTFESTSDANNPANLSTKTAGTFTYTIWNGVVEGTQRTATLQWEGATSIADPSYVSAGQLARWTAGAGITVSGSDVTAWLDQVSSKALTVVGTPVRATGVGGTVNLMVQVQTDEGFTFSDLTNFPVSNADRTLQFLVRFTGTQKFFGGFGYGNGVTDQAFSIAVNDTGQLSLDVFTNRYLLGITPTNQFVMVTARLSGGVLSVWLAGVKVFEQSVSLGTALTRGNVCRSFSNKTTTADICLMLVYGRALSDAEIRANVDVAKGEFIGTGQVTDPAAPTGGSISQNDFVASGTANVTYGVRAWSVRTSSTAATEAEILAGTGAVAFGVTIFDGSGSWSHTVTSLSPSTAYYVNVIDYDLTGGKSAVVRSNAITTAAAAGAAPVISSLSVPTPSSTGGTAQFTSDQAGTYDLVVYLATQADPSVAQLEAGLDGNNQPVLTRVNDAVGASGSNSQAISGLISSTAYKVAVLFRNAQGTASNLLSASFTTAAAVVTTRDFVIGLSNGNTPVGRTSTNPLKTIAANGVPTGWSLSGQTLLAQVNGAVLEDYDLVDTRVDTNGKTDVIIRQCNIKISGTAFNGTYLVYLSPAGHRWTVEYCNIWGNYGVSDESALIYQPYSGNMTSARGLFRRNSVKWMQNDGFKCAGGGPNPGEELVIEECYFGFPANIAADLIQYSGTPSDYHLGDVVRFDVRDYACRCTVATASIAPAPSGNAEWAKLTPHSDYINPLGNVGAGMIVRKVFFDTNRKAAGAARAVNITNNLRLVRNTGTTVDWNKFRGENLYLSWGRSGASIPVQSGGGGNPNYNGPIEIVDSWFGSNYGGTYFQDSSNKVTVWTNVVDELTGAALAQP